MEVWQKEDHIFLG
jgi:hypothetical protein